LSAVRHYKDAAPGHGGHQEQATSLAGRSVQCSAWLILCFLEAVFAAQPGWAQTSPAAVPSASAPSITTGATNPPAQTLAAGLPGRARTHNSSANQPRGNTASTTTRLQPPGSIIWRVAAP